MSLQALKSMGNQEHLSSIPPPPPSSKIWGLGAPLHPNSFHSPKVPHQDPGPSSHLTDPAPLRKHCQHAWTTRLAPHPRASGPLWAWSPFQQRRLNIASLPHSKWAESKQHPLLRRTPHFPTTGLTDMSSCAFWTTNTAMTIGCFA